MIKPPEQGNDFTGTATYYNYSNVTVIGGQKKNVVYNSAYSSINTPGFRKLSRRERREVAEWKPFTYNRAVCQLDYGRHGYLDHTGQPHYWEGYCQGTISAYPGGKYLNENWLFAHPNFGEARAVALSRLQNAISGAKVNLAQAYAERKQTAGLINKYVNNLTQLALDVKHGRFALAARRAGLWCRDPIVAKRKYKRLSKLRPVTDNLSNYWLEYAYGWKPLLSDIYGAAEKLADTYELQRPTVFVATSKRGVDWDNVLMASGSYATDDFWTPTWEDRMTGQSIERWRFVIEAVEDNDVLQALASTGITNPLNLAWELLPYSFVIDWFIPVGNYLQQLTYATGLSFRRGSESVRFTFRGTSRTSPVRGLSFGSIDLMAGLDKRFTHEYKQRTILTSWPYQKFPSFKPNLGVEKVLSGISLLSQLFSRKVK
jgi:hypothetical protein